MISKCQCQNCSGSIEFETADFEVSGETAHRKLGPTILCPHCQKETILYLTKWATAAPKFIPQNDKVFWFKIIGVVLAATFLGILVWAFYHYENRSWISDLGEVTGKIFLVGVFLLFAAAFYFLFVSGILLQLIISLLIGLGLLLCASGVLDHLDVEANKDATVFQQIYALLEFVGGALVFCGALILDILRRKFAAKTE
jgi:uncharacterized membrane protein YidH (DUF202 family)